MVSSSRDEFYAIPEKMESLDSFFTLLDRPKDLPEPPQITNFVIFGLILLKTGVQVRKRQQWVLHERNQGLELVKHELITFFPFRCNMQMRFL